MWYVCSNTMIAVRRRLFTSKRPFTYKVTGGPGEFMGGHHKNTCRLGRSQSKILKAGTKSFFWLLCQRVNCLEFI